MSDESYALAIAEYERGRGSRYYFLGANVGIYLAWSTSGLIGALLGAAIPDPARYGLDLAFPLGFLGLLTAFLKNRVGVAVALAAGGLALLGTCLLPGRWAVGVRHPGRGSNGGCDRFLAHPQCRVDRSGRDGHVLDLESDWAMGYRGSSKPFERVYTVLWYISPMNRTSPLDFAGASSELAAACMPLCYLGLATILLGLASVARR